MELLTEPTDKDLLVYQDNTTNKLKYLDLRTGKQYDREGILPTEQYSPALADLICSEIREGKSLQNTCKTFNISQSQFYGWLSIFPEFKKRYTEARKQRADYHFHRALHIAEGALGASKEDIPGIKLAVDTHKWAAEKSDPERFAKPKEEGNTGMGSITINLTTGVIDKPAPADIVVDQFGNFQGFGEVSENEEVVEEIVLTELSTNRFGTDDIEE